MWASLTWCQPAGRGVQSCSFIQSINGLAIPIQSSIIKTEREELEIQENRLKTRVNNRGSK